MLPGGVGKGDSEPMTRRTKLLGWFLYRLREALNELRCWMIRWPDYVFWVIEHLDRNEGETYWRRKDRGI